MKSAQELYNERLHRIKTAVELGTPDRVPIVPAGIAFAANHLGVKTSEFAVNAELSHRTMFDSFTSLGEIDGVQESLFHISSLSSLWLSKFKLPGRDLPENSLWQTDEIELMKVADYDTIIDKGYNYFLADYYKNRLDDLGAQLKHNAPYYPLAAKNFREAGIVVMQSGCFTIPYEMFCGGRTLTKFTRDLFKTPDKVQAAMDIAMIDILATIKMRLSASKPVAVWVGGWRAASEFLSPKPWHRFVWPYFKQAVEAVIAEGVIPVLHLDSNWERDLEFFRELPKGKCIFSPDGSTDIFKVKAVLGDHMCIMGDVPAAMLTIGTTDDVYEYSTKLIREIGPAGYILSTGCDLPFNAKVDNVKAMIAAATGK